VLKHHAMKTYGGIDPPFLTSTLDGGEWSNSRPGRFTPGERAPGFSLNRRLGVPQSLSGRCGKEKIYLAPAGNRTRDVQPVAIPTELSRLFP
jgi:hypothetical protein